MADLVLDGVVCEQCGVYLEEAVGYPRTCPACEGLRDEKEGTREEEAEAESPFDQRFDGARKALPGQERGSKG
jgi:hypothetical protein